MTDKTDALVALADAERKALEGLLSNLANDAGDVDDEAPWIGDDEDAYWAYHTYHAIQKLKALAAPAASVDVEGLRNLSAQIRPGSEAAPWVCKEIKRLIDSAGGAKVYQCPRCSTSMEVDPTAKPAPQPAEGGVDQAWPIDWIADGHNVRIRADDARVLVFINGSESQCSRDDANALLALLESLENGGME